MSTTTDPLVAGHAPQLQHDGSWWAACSGCSWFSSQPQRTEQDATDEWAQAHQPEVRP